MKPKARNKKVRPRPAKRKEAAFSEEVDEWMTGQPDDGKQE